MVGRSAEGEISPAFGSLGWVFILAAVFTWLLGLKRAVTRPPQDSTSDEDPFLIEGRLPSWPKTRLFAPWMVGAVLIHLATLLWAAEEVKHLKTLEDVDAESCVIQNARVYETDETIYVQIQLVTHDDVRSPWLKTEDSIRTESEGQTLIDERYSGHTEVPCYRSGLAAYHIELSRPSREDLWWGYIVALACVYTLCLLAARQWRSWAYRGGTMTLRSTQLQSGSIALNAALVAMGDDIPGGFETHATKDGTLVIGVVRVGMEEKDAFISIFHTGLSAVVLYGPLIGRDVLTNQVAGWVAILILLVSLAFAFVAFWICRLFLRNCVQRTVLTLTEEEVCIQRRVLFSISTDVCSRRAIQCVTQVQDGGYSSDSFPSWGLMLEAKEQWELLHREESHRSRWLGPVIAAWAAVPYRHAGPFSSVRP